MDQAPDKAMEAAKSALITTGLWNSFGCVDLILTPADEWLVLEVGTDGIFNHVDRDIGDSNFEHLIDERITAAFWQAANG